ncbi:class I SAM-dependent methyltransferase [Dehalococcoides mccartyi]|nr:class I SAM-dependent methyltransferase [Dehalococcoides mccartyi]
MKITDIVNRQIPALPWDEGEKIPWDEPEFSERMLKEHLSQDHDLASRRFEIVHRQVDYIERLGGADRDLKILDLACGPGLHSLDFARRGHSTFGIDFSPASIAWAKNEAKEHSLDSQFLHSDIRTADFGSGYDVAMLLFGEMNVFSSEDLRKIIGKARRALKQGGVLLLEPHFSAAVRENFEGTPSWSANKSGLFSAHPHMLLEEGFWHEDDQTAVKRWYLVDAESGEVSIYSQTVVTYAEADLVTLVESEGFTVSESPSGWATGNEGQSTNFYQLVAIVK